MKNIAIIPARSGSKGLKDKNIRMLNNKPLISYTIEAAIKSRLFNEVYVSTDSEKYAMIAREFGANVPFLRSQNLSSDTSSSMDAVKEALLKYKLCGKEFDTVAILQPTSPLRKEDDIINGYYLLEKKNANAIVSVSEVDHSPLWCNILPKDNSLENFLNDELVNMPRQSLPIYYRINGALYIAKTDYIVHTNNLYKEKCFAYIMSKENSIDIDDLFDFHVAEALIKDNA